MQIARQTHAHGIVVDPRIQQPAAGHGIRDDHLQHLAQQHHLDLPVAQDIDKGHVVDARLFHPEHVIKQQAFRVCRGQPRHFRSGPVDQNAAQHARLGMNAIGQGHVGVPPSTVASASAAMTIHVRTTSSGQTKRSQRS